MEWNLAQRQTNYLAYQIQNLTVFDTVPASRPVYFMEIYRHPPPPPDRAPSGLDLNDRNAPDVGRRIAPEHIAIEASKQGRWQNGLAFQPLDPPAHGARTARAEREIEIVRLIIDGIEIMGEGRFIQQRIQMPHRIGRRARQRLVFHQNEFARFFPVKPLAQGIERVTDQPIDAGEPARATRPVVAAEVGRPAARRVAERRSRWV